MSKLPKPIGSTNLLKPPSKIKSIQPVKPLATLSVNTTLTFPNLRPRAHEAPPSMSKYAPLPANRIKRRSKSVTDLTKLLDKQPFAYPFKSFKTTEKKAAPQNKVLTSTSKAPVKPSVTKNTMASKRHLSNKAEDGAPKNKMAKKLPDWDYKGRFYQLNEKYEQLQNRAKSMKSMADDYEIIKADLEKIQQEYEKILEQNQSLSQENCTISKERQALKADLDELKPLYNNLLVKYDEKQTEFDKLTMKYENLKKQYQNVSENLEKVNNENKELKDVITLQNTNYINYQNERRMLHNTIQDLKGNIRVFCRVRPPVCSELDKAQCVIEYKDENCLEIQKSCETMNQITGKLQELKSDFKFDKVFGPTSTQEEVFEDLSQLVQSALDGYDVCVFAYGQTGSGKTFTMQGAEGSYKGMIPRTSDLIFEKIITLQKTGWSYTVKASFLEIYNENLKDLLNINQCQDLKICYNEGRGTTVMNLTIQLINSAEELNELMAIAHKNRATASTFFNEHSSRSHAVTKIYIEGTFKDIVYRGSINLVDLAGSESAKESVAGDRLTETKSINKSLANLGDVIQHLHNKSKHIPYRNTKLTYLLQSSLGGNSKTLMIVNISPLESCYMESVNSLRFAAKVKQVKTGSKRNKTTAKQ